jgi:hypothetical protein
MNEFIKTQYNLYKSGGKSIGIEKIKQLANAYMTEDEILELFKDDETINIK